MEYSDFSGPLQHGLLTRLRDRLERERPDSVTLSSELHDANVLESQRWEEAWKEPIQPEVGILSALYDLTKGLRSLDFLLERVRITTDKHEWDFATRYEAVAHAAALDSVEDLLKRFGRSGLVAPEIVKSFSEELERHRKDESGKTFPFLELQHETAHTAQHNPGAVNRAAENSGLWEILALEGVEVDPSEWVRLPTHMGRDQLFIECRDALRNVQDMCRRICDSFVAALS